LRAGAERQLRVRLQHRFGLRWRLVPEGQWRDVECVRANIRSCPGRTSSRPSSTGFAEPATGVLHDDGRHYQRWILHVAKWIEKHDSRPYKLHLDEGQWAERATSDGTYVMAPNEYALQAGPQGLPQPPPPPKAARDIWIEGVLRYFESNDQPYQLDAGEREWAVEAIQGGVLEWERESLTVRLPRAKSQGPYR
jgi:hypothetical protein